MADAVADRRVDLVARLTAACGSEIAKTDPAATISWAALPTVAAMTVHLGGVHRWVTEIVRTSQKAAEGDASDLRAEALHDWFMDGCAALVATLDAAPPARPCWVIGGRVGTVAFWQRRMVFENAKHLIDLRAAGGGAWAAVPELDADDYADGIDELLTEFLPRTRSRLPRLPGSVGLHASDSSRSWQINPDWTTHIAAAEPAESVQVTARASDIALMLWERADLLDENTHVEIDGSRDTLAALQASSMHPW